MKNLENCKLVLDQIEKHPETWIQEKWHCGSSHCFAGWAQILSGKEPNDDKARIDARIFLGLSVEEANYYFAANRTLSELENILEDFYDNDGFNRDGFDRDGFDRDGFKCNGFNRNGYDRDGYDADGLDINNNLIS